MFGRSSRPAVQEEHMAGETWTLPEEAACRQLWKLWHQEGMEEFGEDVYSTCCNYYQANLQAHLRWWKHWLFFIGVLFDPAWTGIQGNARPFYIIILCMYFYLLQAHIIHLSLIWNTDPWPGEPTPLVKEQKSFFE